MSAEKKRRERKLGAIGGEVEKGRDLIFFNRSWAKERAPRMTTWGVPIATVTRYARAGEEAALLMDIALTARLFEAARSDVRTWHARATVRRRVWAA